MLGQGKLSIEGRNQAGAPIIGQIGILFGEGFTFIRVSSHPGPTSQLGLSNCLEHAAPLGLSRSTAAISAKRKVNFVFGFYNMLKRIKPIRV